MDAPRPDHVAASTPAAKGVAVVRLGAGGRLTEEVLRDLREDLAALERDADVQVIVLLGRGRVFALGADTDAIGTMSDAALDDYLRAGQRVGAALHTSRKLTIAAVNGLAFGGGMELALACDVRWAHRRAAFELPECRRGLLPAWGATRLVRGALPASLAVEMLCARRITAGEALCFGLVSRVFGGPSFEPDVLAAAARLASDAGRSLPDIIALWRHEGSAEEHAAAERRLLAMRRAARVAR